MTTKCPQVKTNQSNSTANSEQAFRIEIRKTSFAPPPSSLQRCHSLRAQKDILDKCATGSGSGHPEAADAGLRRALAPSARAVPALLSAEDKVWPRRDEVRELGTGMSRGPVRAPRAGDALPRAQEQPPFSGHQKVFKSSSDSDCPADLITEQSGSLVKDERSVSTQGEAPSQADAWFKTAGRSQVPAASTAARRGLVPLVRGPHLSCPWRSVPPTGTHCQVTHRPTPPLPLLPTSRSPLTNTWETPSLKTSVSPRLAPTPRGKKCTRGYVLDTFKDEKIEAPGTAFLKIAWPGGVVVKDGAWATTRSLKPHKVLFYQEASPDTVFQCIRTQGQSEKPDGPPPTPPPPPS